MPLTILEGATFCVSDELGDLVEPTSGFFDSDTRFLSRFVLTIDGARPLLLSSGRVEYYSAAFWLRNPVTGDLGPDELSIARRRFVGKAMQEHVTVVNQARRRLQFELVFELGNDFADIFAVKEYDFALGDPEHARALPPLVLPTFDEQANALLFTDPSGYEGTTQVVLDRPGVVDGSTVRFEISLDPRESWQLQLDVIPSPTGARGESEPVERHFGGEPERVQESLAVWHVRVPTLKTSWDELAHTFAQSVSDLASLRIRDVRGRNGSGQLPAAGMPWFMTVFGRDTVISALQTLLFGPDLAETALHALADLQATEDDPEIDAEPGKIPHEIRRGKGASAWFPRYYGTVDATPLYLVLLSEVWRWTDDADLIRDLREPALAALNWIDEYGDLDGDGFVEFRKRSTRGLEVQSWKDSPHSQLFSDGTSAKPPIAACEVQGYVYDAKLRTAELAREVWRDRSLAKRLEAEAEALQDHFDRHFWCERDGGYFALALDGEKRQVDSKCSNMGHLLWSGIVKSDRVDAVVDHLMGEGLWSGWGVRTMSSDGAGFNPLSYHNGSVWPHDNALIAYGLAHYERWPEAYRIVRRLLQAAAHFQHQLPEVFAGFPRTETPFPISYPTAAKPQAWAAGAPILLLRVLLGLEPDRHRHVLRTIAPPELPSWTGSLRLAGVRAFERSWDVRLEDGRVNIGEA